jgi:hypothetical protein
MSQSRAVQVLSPSDVAAVLVRMQRSDSTPLDPATARPSPRASARRRSSGRLAAAGPGYLVSIELTRRRRGLCSPLSGTADGVKDLLCRRRSHQKLRGKLGESPEVQNAVPLERATTANPRPAQYTEAPRQRCRG